MDLAIFRFRVLNIDFPYRNLTRDYLKIADVEIDRIGVLLDHNIVVPCPLSE